MPGMFAIKKGVVSAREDEQDRIWAYQCFILALLIGDDVVHRRHGDIVVAGQELRHLINGIWCEGDSNLQSFLGKESLSLGCPRRQVRCATEGDHPHVAQWSGMLNRRGILRGASPYRYEKERRCSPQTSTFGRGDHSNTPIVPNESGAAAVIERIDLDGDVQSIARKINAEESAGGCNGRE